MLENLGFRAIDERSYHLKPRFADEVVDVTLHDMVLERADGEPIELAGHDSRLEGCFLAVFRGDADNDGFNRLILSAGADWREVAAVRAYCAYLRQLELPFGCAILPIPCPGRRPDARSHRALPPAFRSWSGPHPS